MDHTSRPTTQQDLATILGNPEALHMLAFGVKTMGKFIETGRAMSRMAFEATGLVPPPANGQTTADNSARPPGADHAGPPTSSPDGGREGDGEPTMVVPLSAWNRILDQLGNLHEAGQQLAEARERAARAEATAEFQVERRRQAETERDRIREKYEQLTTRRGGTEIDLRTEPEPRPATESAAQTNGHDPRYGDRVRTRLIRLLDR